MKTNENRAVASTSLVVLDDDGNRVSAGDTVRFNYGIPPVCVTAPVVQRGKSLIAITAGHTPAECNLRSLRKYVGGWFKHNNGTRRPGSPDGSLATETRKPGSLE